MTGERPPSDPRAVLVPAGDTWWPDAQVVATAPHAGRRYRCRCGWEGWSAFGRARKHREACHVALHHELRRSRLHLAITVEGLRVIAGGVEGSVATALAALAHVGARPQPRRHRRRL